MTYDENVRAKAEQLVKERYSETYRLAAKEAGYEFDGGWAARYYKKQLEYMIERMLPIAKIALEWCAESITTAMTECMPEESEAYCKGDVKYVINGYLIVNGFIPEPKTEQS